MERGWRKVQGKQLLIQKQNQPQREKMQSGKEKMSNMASAAKEKVEIYKAKAEEKVEKASARTKEEKIMAEERRKAKEAEAKMELHEAKERHAAERLDAKHGHLPGYVEPTPLGHRGHHAHVNTDPTRPVGVTDPALHGTPAPTTYPPSGGHRPGHIL